MRRYAIGFLAFSTLLAVLYFSFPANTKAQMPDSTAKRTPVLVELFTSEGCSSCPSADLLLQNLLAQQPVEGAEIIALEAHVDYWNRLGWADPYSSSQWTERQSDYATVFGNDAYTPELVVDGRTNFVGSNAREAHDEIRKAARQAKAEVSIVPEKTDGGGTSFSVRVGKLPEANAGGQSEVWLAVTEDGLRSSVSRGENAGRTLTHASTLRSLQKIGEADAHAAVAFQRTSRVKLDSRWGVENLRVIVFVQDATSRQVLGAASIPLKS